MHYATDADAKNLLDNGKLIAVPVVNPDGYDLSRSLQNEQKRKNCRITAGVIPTLAECTATANVNRGIDLNRNYIPFWGGPGSSTSQTASNTRGEFPASEPEIEALIEKINSYPATVAINNHTPDQRLLRAPSSSNEPDVVYDQAAYQALLERLDDNLTGWPSGPWTDVYYEASSTAEQQAFYAYGAFGFTPEATPGFSGNQTFHPPYENVINNYLGIGPRYAGQTMRGLYYDAFKAAIEPALHSVIKGTAAPGATLTLTKTNTLDTSNTVWTTGQPAAGPLVPEHDPDDAHRPRQRPVRVAREPVGAPEPVLRPGRRRGVHADLHRGRRHGAGDDDGEDPARPAGRPLALHAGRRRRHGAGDAVADAGHAGDVRRVHARRRA